MNRLNTLELKSYFESLLEELCHFVFVQAVSVDNHIVNGTFYQQLCGGMHRTSIEHLCVAGERLFLLFETTHNMKNIFNNWVSEKELSFNVLDYQRFETLSLSLQIDKLVLKRSFPQPHALTEQSFILFIVQWTCSTTLLPCAL